VYTAIMSGLRCTARHVARLSNVQPMATCPHSSIAPRIPHVRTLCNQIHTAGRCSQRSRPASNPYLTTSTQPFHTSPSTAYSQALKSHPPKSHDRGPASSETTQTDFESLDVLGGTPVPSTAIDACLWDGFHLNNGVKITQGAGVLLVGGEAFGWRPWDAGSKMNAGEKRLLNEKGQWEIDDGAWGVLEVVWPKPGMFRSVYCD
jgi:NADH dehydrogenase [ubiquinone] 1 alpha subcomplex assembly factor 3